VEARHAAAGARCSAIALLGEMTHAVGCLNTAKPTEFPGQSQQNFARYRTSPSSRRIRALRQASRKLAKAL
jgi:hypothetical protein